MGRFAGRKGSYAAAIRHTGRKSGKSYSTPVGSDRTADGFLIPVAYGTQVDWLQNVLAAGRAVLSVEGEDHEVIAPQLVDAATALPMLPSKRRRNFERLGIAHFLEVTIADQH
jgi:deazaflavin-dependent oxidoreductase (nitroreductase family)